MNTKIKFLRNRMRLKEALLDKGYKKDDVMRILKEKGYYEEPVEEKPVDPNENPLKEVVEDDIKVNIRVKAKPGTVRHYVERKVYWEEYNALESTKKRKKLWESSEKGKESRKKSRQR